MSKPALFIETKAAWLLLIALVLLVIVSISPGETRVLEELSHTSPASNHSEDGRVGCPQCKNDGSEISQLLQKADTLYAGFKTNEALKELHKVLELDPHNHEALSKIARVHIDFGDMVPESVADWQEKRLEQYLIAEEYARKAVKANPHGTWGHFYVAASLGKIAMQSPVRKQIELASEIQTAVEKAIALDPQNGYAYHVYGVWHRRMAEIGQMSRAVASIVYWRSLPKGSMETSAGYLKKAISLNPKVISHHLELAKTYMAMGKWQLARGSLKRAQELPNQVSDDPLNKEEIQYLLQEIKDR